MQARPAIRNTSKSRGVWGMDEDITDDVDRGDAKSRPRRFDGLSGGVSGGVSVPVLCTANFCVYACVRVRKQRASRVRECVPGPIQAQPSPASTDLPLQSRVTACDRRGQVCHGCGLGSRCNQCSRVCIWLAKGIPRIDSTAVVAGKAVLDRPSGRTAGRASRADNVRLFAVHADSVRHPRRPGTPLAYWPDHVLLADKAPRHKKNT